MFRLYVLKLDTIPVEIETINEWRDYFDNNSNLVKKKQIGDAYISTVFLGIDHSGNLDGKPLLFETMVFGGEYDRHQERYYTYEEAVEGHKKIVSAIKSIVKDEEAKKPE